MPSLYESGRGVATIVTEGRPPVLFAISIGGFARKFGVLSQVQTGDNVNLQLTHTTGNEIYAAIFGERATELRIAGVAFPRVCQNGQTISTAYEHTLEEVAKNYRENNAGKTGKTTQVAIGKLGYKALLVGMDITAGDPETGIAQWSYRMIGVPVQ